MSLMTFDRLVPMPVFFVTSLAHTGLMILSFLETQCQGFLETPFLLASLKLQLNSSCPSSSLCF